MDNIIYESHRDNIADIHMFEAHNSDIAAHFHRTFEIIYVIDGNMRSTIAGNDILASADDIVFVQKYYSHSYKPADAYDKYVIMISPNIDNDFGEILIDKTLPALMADKQFNRSLLPFIKQLSTVAHKSPLIKKGYADVIMGELIAHYPLEPIRKNNSAALLAQILDYIDRNCDKPISLDSISAAFGYNKYYFSKLFNRYIGENLNSYINIVRLQQMIKKAKTSTKINITELAYACGFDSLSTFYRYFKKIYGTSPREILAKT